MSKDMGIKLHWKEGGRMIGESFGPKLLKKEKNLSNLATAYQVRRGHDIVPYVLKNPIRDQKLENWFKQEASIRIKSLKPGLSSSERQDALEMGNRLAEGEVSPIPLSKLLQMNNFYGSAADIVDRANQGIELLKNNLESDLLGTAARGTPCGGASTRSAKWARENPEIAARFGFSERTPRFLYRVGGKTLSQITLEFSNYIAKTIGKVFPNIVMTNTEIVEDLMKTVRSEWGNFIQEELENTIFFNQIVLPRMWMEDQKIIEGKLYPAGHGDYPYLFAKYKMAKTLVECGIKYLIFSNADEWLWQADPVMISIAHELFQKGNHMVIIGVENINNQFGGGFVEKRDGTQALVEAPRLPWSIVKEKKAPIALNTTFYAMDVEYLAANEEKLLNVNKSMIVKEVPGRQLGCTEQIFGVDSWAGDVFSEVLNPAFIQWPRLNFLGIKDGGFISGSTPVDGLGGRTYLHYVNETVATFPSTMRRLINGDRSVAEFLFRNGYSYL